MAILTSDELTQIRRACDRSQAIPINYTKAQVNAAVQALEDWFEGARPAINTAVNAATAPFVFTAAQKREILRHWLQQKFERGG